MSTGVDVLEHTSCQPSITYGHALNLIRPILSAGGGEWTAPRSCHVSPQYSRGNGRRWVRFSSPTQCSSLNCFLCTYSLSHNYRSTHLVAPYARPLYAATKSKTKAVLAATISGGFEVLGCVLVQIFFEAVTPFFMEAMLSLVAGIMVALGKLAHAHTCQCLYRSFAFNVTMVSISHA